MRIDYSIAGKQWRRAARRRRSLLLGLILIPTIMAARFLAEMLPEQASTPLEIAIVAVFAILFAWISSGFWTSVMGFVTLFRKGDKYAITNSLLEDGNSNTRLSKTAIIMPIYNEDIPRVFKGLESIYRSVQKTGLLEHFDFYVLSDSNDPDKWVEEELAWAELCQRVNGFDRVYYRMRRSSIKRKSGNVADFCRRWGKNYAHMIVLDADSIMLGDTIVRLVRMMDANPGVGIIQTLPVAVNRESLYARMQQFSNRIYGTMFAAGLHYWQLGEAHYWGHNAIIRVAPFMSHCGLPRLPGKGALGGDIMSHDFVEAALMRRAGWSNWLAYDLDGSYEETATTLPDDLKRDRRWAHGNLQHLKLLLVDGIHSVHRALFVNGIFAYVTSPLWFTLLVLSSFEAILQAATPIEYFGNLPSLFPQWPVSYQLWAVGLFVFTMCLLFLPKILALALMFRNHQHTRDSGGRLRLLSSVVLESLTSMLVAPIRMAVHTRIIIQTLLGGRAGWGAQQRNEYELGWGSAFKYHGLETLTGIIWGVTVYLLAPGFFWWLTPVLLGLVLAVPLSIVTSRKQWGVRARRWGFFRTPEETNPKAELQNLNTAAKVLTQNGFMRAVVDPFVNALHVWFLRRESGFARRPWVEREGLIHKFIEQGGDSLSTREKFGLLSDAKAMAALHMHVWEADKSQFHLQSSA